MKRAISMKCNQEQWDSIKGKLVECEIEMITSFDICNYLVNNIGNCSNLISNCTMQDKLNYKRKVYEIFNEQVFLEACGIETKKIFK